MSTTTNVTWDEIRSRAYGVAQRISNDFSGLKEFYAYPIPNGGIFAAQAVQRAGQMLKPPVQIELIESIGAAYDKKYVAPIVLIDDIVDSGATRRRYNPPHKFYALFDKLASEEDERLGWVSFPWERMHENKTEGPEENVRRLLQFIEGNAERDGLKETPARVVRSFAELYRGYKLDPAGILSRTFDEKCDEMIILRNCEFYSTCEHHLQPFFGRAHVGYLPAEGGPVAGLSKLARVVDAFARRLQIQERLTSEIADAIETHLKPRGVGVVLEAKHFCMVCRGVNKQQSEMVTSALRGFFREAAARAEFFSFIKG